MSDDSAPLPAATRGPAGTAGALPAVPLGPRLVLTVLAALAAWEAGQVLATWLVVQVLAPGVPLAFSGGPGWQVATLAALLLRVAVVLGIAAPAALLLLRPVLGYRER